MKRCGYYPRDINEYILSKSLEKNKKHKLYASGGICHVFEINKKNWRCNAFLKCGGHCEECQLDLQNSQKHGRDKTAV